MKRKRGRPKVINSEKSKPNKGTKTEGASGDWLFDSILTVQQRKILEAWRRALDWVEKNPPKQTGRHYRDIVRNYKDIVRK